MNKSQPELGTSEFDAQVKRQSQDAMGSAAAVPVARVFCACLFVVTLSAAFILFESLLSGDSLLWAKVVLSFGYLFCFGLLALQLGAIAFAGKVGYRWIRTWIQRS